MKKSDELVKLQLFCLLQIFATYIFIPPIRYIEKTLYGFWIMHISFYFVSSSSICFLHSFSTISNNGYLLYKVGVNDIGFNQKF